MIFDLASDFRNTLADGTSRGNLVVFRYAIVKTETRNSGQELDIRQTSLLYKIFVSDKATSKTDNYCSTVFFLL